MPYDIFISYKRKSLPTANNLYYRLTTRGYSTFFDLEEMGRDNFNVQLLNYIENAKDVFVILEEGSLDGCKKDKWEEEDWFCHEIAFALEKKKNIIPILLNGYQMPSQDFFPDRLKELSLKNAPEFNFSFFEAYLDKLIEKEYLLSKPNIQDKSTSVFKFYSNENCQVFKDGKLICSLEGMSDEPYYLPIRRKGDYRFKAVNVITTEQKVFKEYIDFEEDKEVEIEWAEHKSFKPNQEWPEKSIMNGEKSLIDSVIEKKTTAHGYVSLLRRRHDSTGHYGYVNEKGNYVIPPVWKWIPNAILKEEDCTFVQNDLGMWGLLDGKGRIVTSCIWDDISFSWGRKFAAVKNSKKWGIVNDKGIIIIDYIFDELKYEVYWEVYCVRKDKKWGIIKTNGEVIAACEYDEFLDVHRDVNKRSELLIIKKNGLWGGIDDKGCIKIPCVWKEISDESPFKDLIKVKDFNDKWGFLDFFGRTVVLPKWKEIDDNMSDGLVAVEDGNGKYGYINDVGSVVIQCKYWYARSFSEGLAYARDNEGGGYINTNGEFVIRENGNWEVDSCYKFHNGIVIVYTWNKETSECFYGCINTEGELVIPLVWDYIWRSADDRMWVRDKNDQWGVIDVKGNTIVPCQYKKDGETEFFFQSSFCVLVDALNRKGVFDKQGNLIVPFGDWGKIDLPWNDSIMNDYISIISVQDKTGKYGFYDTNGRKITLCIWNNNILGFSKWTGLACVQGENNKYGYIDLNGKLVIPCIYNKTYQYDADIQGYLVEDENGICRYIDKYGNCIR